MRLEEGQGCNIKRLTLSAVRTLCSCLDLFVGLLFMRSRNFRQDLPRATNRLSQKQIRLKPREGNNNGK